MNAIEFNPLLDATGKPIVAVKFAALNTADNQIDAMLLDREIEYRAVLVGATKRDDWECDAWRVSFGKFTTDYFTGIGHRKQKNKYMPPKPVTPTAASVLYCLFSDAEACEMSYQDWCDNFGYDSDSIKALNTYRACEATGHELRKLFDFNTRAKMREILQDY